MNRTGLPRLASGAMALLWAVLGLGFGARADGHAPGENYIFLAIDESGGITGRFEFGVEDLKAYGLLDTASGKAEEVLAAAEKSAAEAQAYIEKNFELFADGKPVELTFTKLGILNELAHFVQYHFEGTAEKVPETITVRHEMMYEHNSQHRGLVILSNNPVTGRHYGEEWVAMILGPESATQTMDLRNEIVNLIADRLVAPPVPASLGRKGLIRSGFVHVLTGLDHVLLLLMLLAPVMLVKAKGAWTPEPSRARILKLAAVVLAVVGLSMGLGLGLSGLGVVKVPVVISGSLAAAAVLVFAVNILSPFLPRAGFLAAAAVFGLAHGFFLGDPIGTPPYVGNKMIKVTGAFGVGAALALAGLAVVALAVLLALRRTSFYHAVVLRGGAAVAALIATFLLFQRLFHL